MLYSSHEQRTIQNGRPWRKSVRSIEKRRVSFVNGERRYRPVQRVELHPIKARRIVGSRVTRRAQREEAGRRTESRKYAVGRQGRTESACKCDFGASVCAHNPDGNGVR